MKICKLRPSIQTNDFSAPWTGADCAWRSIRLRFRASVRPWPLPLLPGYFAVILLAMLATGCDPKEAVEAAKDEPTAESATQNIVSLSPKNLELVPIHTTPVELGSLGMTIQASGRISANLNKTAKVTPTLEGRLIRMDHDLGDRVKAGEIVAQIDSPELLGKPLDVRAPIEGTIIERHAAVGELVGRGTSIYTISDPSDLWVIAEVKERDIATIRPQQEVSFTTLAFLQERFHGKVSRIGDQVESGSRTVEVRVIIEDPKGKLKPGMFADVAITTTMLDGVLVIPDSALQTYDQDQVVFVATGTNSFEKRVVTLGLEQAGRVQILSGVQAGDHVVSEGAFMLKSELLKGEMGED